MLIANLQGLHQSLSLGVDPIDNAVRCFSHGGVDGSLLCDECMKLILPIFCYKLVSILVTDRASLLTDHRMSGLPILARYKHF